MGMVAFIVKGGIPAEILAVDLHVLGKHGFFTAEQILPLFSAVIPKPCGILPAQTDNMSPDSTFVTTHILLHSCQHHRNACIGEEAMLADALHTRAACDVIHIVFPFADEAPVLLQCQRNKLSSVADGRVLAVVGILQHFLGRGNIPDELIDELLLFYRSRKQQLALINLFYAITGSDVLHIVFKLGWRDIPHIL